MRHAAAAGLLATVALLTAACGDSQPGTAAYVGDTTVTVDALQSQVDAVLAYRDGSPTTGQGAVDVRTQVPAVTQQVLSQDVLRGLVATAVARTGLTVDEASITSQLASLDSATILAQPGQEAFTPDTLTALVRDQLVLAQLGKRAWDGLAVTIDLVTATDRTDAETTARRMAVSDDASAAVVKAATDAQVQAQEDLAVTPATQAALTATPVFAAPAGSAVAFQIQGQTPQWYAVRIISRATDAPTPTGADAVPAATAPTGDAVSLGLTLLPQLAGDPQVRLNPRYGQWDPTATRVIASSDVPAALVVTG